MPDASPESADVLRAHGFQVTAQRLAVLDAVSAHPHATANEIAIAVRDHIGSISRQSVYDTLTALSERQIVRRIQPVGSATRYERRVGDHHHHLACRGCDLLIDVDGAVGPAPSLTSIDDWDLDIDDAEVVYWGTCPACRQTTT